MNDDEPQTREVIVEFRVKHNPGNGQHHDQILANFFRAKGVHFEPEKVIDGRVITKSKIII